MSRTKQTAKAVKLATNEQLATWEETFETRVRIERNAMVRSSFRGCLDIVHCEQQRRDLELAGSGLEPRTWEDEG